MSKSPERYTPEEAETEASILKDKIEKGEARDYGEAEKLIERQKRDEQFKRVNEVFEGKEFEGKYSAEYLSHDLKTVLEHLDRYLEQAQAYSAGETPKEWKVLIEQNPELGVLNYGEEWYDGIFQNKEMLEKAGKKRQYARFSDDNCDNPIFGNASKLTWILSRLDPESRGFTSHSELEKSGLIGEEVRKKVSDLIEEHIKIADKINAEIPDKVQYPERPKQFYQIALKKYGQDAIDFARKAKEVMQAIVDDIETKLKEK